MGGTQKQEGCKQCSGQQPDAPELRTERGRIGPGPSPTGAGSVHTFQVSKSSLVEAACAIIGKGKDSHRLCLLGLCPGDACLDRDTELMGASVQVNMNFPTP